VSVTFFASCSFHLLDILSPQKAAILLSLALTKTFSPQDIQRFFDEY
jgi:hypothetical protein